MAWGPPSSPGNGLVTCHKASDSVGSEVLADFGEFGAFGVGGRGAVEVLRV